MDGCTIWNTNIEQAVNYCTQALNFEEKDIIVDIMITETKDTLREWEKSSASAGVNLMRGQNIKSSYKGTNVIDASKRAHPDIDYRLLIEEADVTRA